MLLSQCAFFVGFITQWLENDNTAKSEIKFTVRKILTQNTKKLFNVTLLCQSMGSNKMKQNSTNIEFETKNFGDNYEQLIEYLNCIYNVNRDNKQLYPDENNTSSVGEYEIYHVLNEEYKNWEQEVSDTTKINKFIESGEIISKLSLNVKIQDGNNLRDCFKNESGGQCILYVNIKNSNIYKTMIEKSRHWLHAVFISDFKSGDDDSDQSGPSFKSFKWIPTSLLSDNEDKDDIEWQREFNAFKNEICQEFQLKNNENLTMSYGEPFHIKSSDMKWDSILGERDEENADTIDDEDDLEMVWEKLIENSADLRCCTVVYVNGDAEPSEESKDQQTQTAGLTILKQIRELGMFSDVNDDLLLFAIKIHKSDVSKIIQWGMSFGDEYINAFKRLKETGELASPAVTKLYENEQSMVKEIRSLGLFIDISDELIRLAIKENNNDISQTIIWGLEHVHDYNQEFSKLVLKSGLVHEIKRKSDSEMTHKNTSDELVCCFIFPCLVC